MADEGLINMEDDAPVAPPAEPVTPPPVAAAPEPPAEDPDEKLDASGLLAALKAERAEKKAYKAQAAQVEALTQEVNQSRPYVEFLKAHPELTRPAAPPPPAAPATDPKAVQYAKEFDLYTPDGKPDVEKAQRIMAFNADQAREVAQSIVQPMQETNDRTAAAALYQQALATKGPNGQLPDRQIFNTLAGQLPARLLRDPGVITLLHAATIGFQQQPGGLPVVPPPAAPPIVTEGSGGRPRATTLTEMDKKIAANRGMSETAFAKAGEGFQRGRPSQLED